MIQSAKSLNAECKQNQQVYTFMCSYCFNRYSCIVGFELAITAAPRSMQATAMGILFIPDGIASIVRYEIITRSPHIGYINAYFIAGITGSIGSAVLLLVIHKKWNWHLISGRK